jgi:hypothetical protein
MTEQDILASLVPVDPFLETAAAVVVDALAIAILPDQSRSPQQISISRLATPSSTSRIW